MEKFTTLTGVTAPLDMINIDTDMVIPKQYLTTIKRSGLGRGLFFEMRFDADGNENPDFVLNKPQYRDAKILVTGENFGCGSSREHAPWALLDFGITCVIAPSFADIFYSNCFQNGVLPVVLPEDVVKKIIANSEANPGYKLNVDLESMRVWDDTEEVVASFDVEPFRRHCMLNGLDEIGLTLEHGDAIDDFEAKRSSQGGVLTF